LPRRLLKRRSVSSQESGGERPAAALIRRYEHDLYATPFTRPETLNAVRC
jgi:hypothetical protein